MCCLCHCHWFGIHALSNEKPTSNFDLKIFFSGKVALYHLKLALSIASITVYTNPVHSRALQQRAGPPSPQTDPSASSGCAGLRSCSSWTLQERRAHIITPGEIPDFWAMPLISVESCSESKRGRGGRNWYAHRVSGETDRRRSK